MLDDSVHLSLSILDVIIYFDYKTEYPYFQVMHAEVLRNKIKHLQLSNFLSNDSGKIKRMSKNKQK